MGKRHSLAGCPEDGRLRAEVLGRGEGAGAGSRDPRPQISCECAWRPVLKAVTPHPPPGVASPPSCLVQPCAEQGGRVLPSPLCLGDTEAQWG